jgi:uncharacterized protein
MQYRMLGRTGMKVTAIGIGCAPMLALSLAEGVRLVRRAVDLGINYFDTARGYGETEVMLGQALQGHRDKVYISTKTHLRTRDEAWRHIHESLQRLQTDYLDNVHLHCLFPGEDVEKRTGPGGALEALVEARERGLVRHIGCTAHTCLALLQAFERFDFETILVPMNMVEREPLAELIPLCRARGVGVTIMKPVATGRLPGRLALKWLLNQPVDTIVPGVTTLDEVELDAVIGALEDWSLTPEESAQADAIALAMAHTRCRVCNKCELYCPQKVWLGDALGSEVMSDHYRNMGREAFAAAPWSVAMMHEDAKNKQELIAKINNCGDCRLCAEHCPYGLPAPDMLRALLPALNDMVAIYDARLRL